MKFLFPLGAFSFFFHKIIINLWMTYENSLASISFAAQYVFSSFHEPRLNKRWKTSGKMSTGLYNVKGEENKQVA